MAETDDLINNETADRGSEGLHNDIASQRATISRIVGKLEGKIHDTMDWKKCFSEHPYAAIGVAVGTGFVASMLLKKKPRQKLAYTVIDRAQRFVHRLL